MTPDERLDQLEPLMADSLQKIDRLIEGQSKLMDLALKTESQVGITAKGLGSLTIKVNQIAENQSKMGKEVAEGFSAINQRFDILQQFLEERLK